MLIIPACLLGLKECLVYNTSPHTDLCTRCPGPLIRKLVGNLCLCGMCVLMVLIVSVWCLLTQRDCHI